MELWIESADKKNLVKAERISVVGKHMYINNIRFEIYDTDERAIEVYEEIKKVMRDYSFRNYNLYIYTLPKK